VTRAGRATGAPLSDKAVWRLVKQAALAAGLPDPARYPGHSLRAGLATAAGEAGATLATVRDGRAAAFTLKVPESDQSIHGQLWWRRLCAHLGPGAAGSAFPEADIDRIRLHTFGCSVRLLCLHFRHSLGARDS
jgi:hypothetical protein